MMCKHKCRLGNGKDVLRVLLPALLVTSSALAQPEIPLSIREGDSSPRGAEEVVERYIEHWVESLESDSRTSVRKIREALTEPLRAPGSDIFKSDYSSRLSRRLRPALSHDDVVVRLNAVMAIGNLIDPGAVPLIESALADSRLGSSAIHLHAARSAARLADSGRLTNDQQTSLVASLRTAYEAERAQPAVEEIMKALGALSTDEAVTALLTIINARTSRHAENPRLPLRAEIESLTHLARKMTRQKLENRLTNGEASVRQMAQVSHRYFCHCAEWLRDAESDDPLRNDHVRMVKLADEVLRLVVEVLDDTARPPDKVESEIDKSRWEEVLLRCAEWKKLLTLQGFTAEQLQISPRQKKHEDGEGPTSDGGRSSRHAVSRSELG